MNQNPDVFLGYIAWAAGSFSTSYVLSLTPTKKDGKYVDNALTTQCVVKPWLDSAAAAGPPGVGTASKMTTITQISTQTKVIGTVTSGTVIITLPATASMNATTSITLPTTISTAINLNQNVTASSTGRGGNSVVETSSPAQFKSAASRNVVQNLFVSGLAATLSIYIML